MNKPIPNSIGLKSGEFELHTASGELSFPELAKQFNKLWRKYFRPNKTKSKVGYT